VRADDTTHTGFDNFLNIAVGIPMITLVGNEQLGLANLVRFITDIGENAGSRFAE